MTDGFSKKSLSEQSRRASKALGSALLSYRRRYPGRHIDVARRIDHGANAYQFRVREVLGVANEATRLKFIENRTDWTDLKTVLEWLIGS